MNTEQGFTLHPGAAQDITDIWEFIVEDNPLAARRVREDILDAVRKLVLFPLEPFPRGQSWTIGGLRARVKSEVNCKQRGTHDGYLESQPGA